VAYNILVVDSDQAFATILKEGLETNGDYRVALTQSGSDALESVVERPFDLVIVDMGLQGVKPVTLVKAIREAKPAMRLMLIPLFGQQIPAELRELKIQGFLPKPFFVGDLPRLVGEALNIETPASLAPPAPDLKVAAPPRRDAKPATPAQESPAPPATTAAPSPPVPSEPQSEPQVEKAPPLPATPKPEAPSFSPAVLARLQAKEQQIVQLLKSLNREVRAESIMVTLGTQLIAFAGLLSREQAANLAKLVADSTDAAAQMATFLGEPSARFEQSMHEGAEYRMYSLSVGEGLVLSLALSSDTPLGTLRYRARQTAEELLELMP
jgi:CheY-like chemotaxis protein